MSCRSQRDCLQLLRAQGKQIGPHIDRLNEFEPMHSLPPSLDQSCDLSVHEAMNVALANDLPCVLQNVLPEDERDATPAQNSDNVARSCATRRHSNKAFFCDHESSRLLPHCVVEARQKSVKFFVQPVQGM